MNRRHVTLRQFRYFVAVAESGSVASASRMLNIAQSALTKSLLELEAELGSSLFERSPKGMRLTPQGHRFLLSARKVIGSVADALRLNGVDAASELSGVLSVGVTSLVAGYYLSELFSRFRRNCPAVEVFVTEDTPALPRAPADQRRARRRDHGQQCAERAAGDGGRDAHAQP